MKSQSKPKNTFLMFTKRHKIALIVTLALIVLYALVHALWLHNREVEDYKQKPLVSGVDFLKRNYNSGCLALDLIMCNLGPEMTVYNYETDLTAYEIIDKFPGWHSNANLNDSDPVTYIELEKNGSVARIFYIDDTSYIKERAERDKLKVSGKKAIVYIFKEDYLKLKER